MLNPDSTITVDVTLAKDVSPEYVHDAIAYTLMMLRDKGIVRQFDAYRSLDPK